jgi:hypothetical protein
MRSACSAHDKLLYKQAEVKIRLHRGQKCAGGVRMRMRDTNPSIIAPAGAPLKHLGGSPPLQPQRHDRSMKTCWTTAGAPISTKMMCIYSGILWGMDLSGRQIRPGSCTTEESITILYHRKFHFFGDISAKLRVLYPASSS